MKSLKNGNKINLSNEVGESSKLAIGLSWDDSHHSAKVRDLDMSAFLVADDLKVPTEQFFVFYNNLHSPDRSIHHKGDNRTGQGDGDDETFWLDLSLVAQEIEQIFLVASIHSSDETVNSFGEIKQIRLRIYDRNAQSEIASYVIGNEFADMNALQIGRFYKEYGTWFFEATAEATTKGLTSFVDKYA